MPLQATSGAASYDAFGGGVAAVPNYIEDVFSTWLYTGNGSTQTITNGIDLAGKGGLVWTKSRAGASSHYLFDSTRALDFSLSSNTTGAQEEINNGNPLTFNSNGFSLPNSSDVNSSGVNYTSWTFREQPKFFDVVTWTGDGTNNRLINHSLGSTPGAIIIKRTNTTANWVFYHRSLSGFGLFLNTTAAEVSANSDNGFVSNSTDTQFRVTYGAVSADNVNASGSTYVAYLFAHNAGGFGLTGTDNVISCGSYTGTGSPVEVNLGYEPQWILTRNVTDADDWFMLDNMRGIATGGTDAFLRANLSNAESTATDVIDLTATGFKTVAAARHTNGKTYIYIAIRRGPMKVPTTGTSVYSAIARTGNGAITTVTGVGFTPDFLINANRTRNVSSFSPVQSRLQGAGVHMYTSLTNPEATDTNGIRGWDVMNGIQFGNDSTSGAWNWSGAPYINWFFGRAPGFFDVVCWTRSTTVATLNHNLQVVPELIIKKDRSRSGTFWEVLVNVSPYDYRYVIYLNDTQAISGPSGGLYWNAAPTATTFDVNMGFDGSSNGDNFVAYLFASAPGVSKVGTYTGTGTTQTINCGFTGGARFVMIKRTDSTGDWYVWDTARGIVSGNDPHLSLNTTAAEVTSNDTIDTDSTGFVVNQVSATNVNVSSATYIFLAIA